MDGYMKLSLVQQLSLAFALAVTMGPLTHAATYYVDRNHALANDANPGTATQPFRSISRAAQVARAGDNVTVQAGQYVESVDVVNSGTVTQPLSFIANGSVVVSPPTNGGARGSFNVLGKSDIVISGFTVKNGNYGIRVDEDRAGTPSTRVTVKNNYPTLTKSSGIFVSDSRDVVVDSNVVEKTNYGGRHEMISIIRTDGFLVKNNEVFNGHFVVNGVAMKGKEGIDAKTGSSNGRIVNNKVHDLEELGIYNDAWDLLTQNIEITGNVVYNCRQGVALSSETGGLLKNILVANNVLYNNRFAGINVSPWGYDGPRENIRIVNNTVYGNGENGIRIGTRNIYRVDIHNNLIANNNGPALNAVNAGLITTSYNNLVLGKNPGNILSGTFEGDPRFVGASTGNFRLGSGSAAINKGRTVAEVPAEILGTLGPMGGAYDVGAYESN